jgi:hypothetical protein
MYQSCTRLKKITELNWFIAKIPAHYHPYTRDVVPFASDHFCTAAAPANHHRSLRGGVELPISFLQRTLLYNGDELA